MKRILVLLSLVCALFLASACHSEVNISVEATANMQYYGGGTLKVGPYSIGGFHHLTLSDADIERIIYELFQGVKRDFPQAELPQIGVLDLRVFDEISGAHLRDEQYGLVYNSSTGYYDFADMNVTY